MFYGGAVAAPIFKEIADKVYSNHIELHGIPAALEPGKNHCPEAKTGQQKELKKILAELNIPVTSMDEAAQNVSSKISGDAVKLSERKTRTGIVPDVSGMGIKDAVYILENSGLRVHCRGRGLVRHQSLSPGAKISKGQTIFIDLGI